jgi:hypothetical protein
MPVRPSASSIHTPTPIAPAAMLCALTSRVNDDDAVEAFIVGVVATSVRSVWVLRSAASTISAGIRTSRGRS